MTGPGVSVSGRVLGRVRDIVEGRVARRANVNLENPVWDIVWATVGGRVFYLVLFRHER